MFANIHCSFPASSDRRVVTASTAGTPRALLSCDVSADGMIIAAGTELHGEDASILYW